MRVYKETYSKSLPDGAKILTRKDGKYARFTNGRGRQKEARLTKDGDRILCETSHWMIDFDDNSGIRRTVKAFTDRSATDRLKDNIQKLLNYTGNRMPPDAELQRYVENLPSKIRQQLAGCGVLASEFAAIGKPLSDFMGAFTDHLTLDKERTPKYINAKVSRIQAAFDACGFQVWSDINAAAVVKYLRARRDGGRGISKRTYNGDVQHIQQFCDWGVEQGYIAVSPLANVQGLDNPETDIRRTRRAASPEELRRLLDATLKGPEREGMDGHERALLYWFAASTGLRANEIRTLTVGAFNFSNPEEPTVKVKAGYSKHRETDVMPLRPELAAVLQSFFKSRNKMPHAKAFGGTYQGLTQHTANMLKEDLAATEVKDASGKVTLEAVPYVDGEGQYFDFHGMRHTFITSLQYVPTRVQQACARHKSSAMTDRYNHSRETDKRAAIDTLPDLSLPSIQSQAAVKTGTDDRPLQDESLSQSLFLRRTLKTSADVGVSRCTDGATETPLSCNTQGSEPMINRRIHPVPSRVGLRALLESLCEATRHAPKEESTQGLGPRSSPPF